MLKVLTCIAVDHDFWLVALAALFCFTASFTAFRLHEHAVQAGRTGRLTWVLLTGLAAGSGIWATHFTAMLAYRPTMPVGYEAMGTSLSLVIAAAATSAAFLAAIPGRHVHKVLAGVLFGLGVGAMHYGGMHAFRPQGVVSFDQPLVSASLLFGVGLAVAAMFAGGNARTLRRQLGGSALLTVSICALHFTAMGAVTIIPDPTVVTPASLLEREQMLIAVGLLTAVVLGGALALAAVDLQARRRSHDQLRLLFDGNPAPMWLLEPATLRFLAVNDAAVRVYGFSRAEFLARTAFDIIHPDEQPALRELVDTPLPAYEGHRIWRHVRADGAEILVEPFAREIPHERRRALLAALFDVTERERAAGALSAAKEAAEAASRAKSEFLANMSHEIRTPLNGVVGVVGALERTRLNAGQKEMVSIIDASAATLLRVLSDVLDVARIEAGGIDLRTEPFELRRVVRDASDLHRVDAEAKGLSYGVEIDEAVAATVEGDADRLRQILGNLLSNAVKFTSAGSVRMRVSAEGERIRFEVADTGIGFDPAEQERLFLRFEQADASMMRRYGGSGLGLSIARDLAQRMGGSLTAASSPGAGSAFTLALPLRAVDAGTPTPVPAAAEAGGGASFHVLVADDHPTNRRVIELILQTTGVSLTTVEDGAQAVEACRAHNYDLILMDLQMPVMDGLEAIGQIRAHERSEGGGAAPIVVLSASALPAHVSASEQAGADGHLSKPIEARALLDVVQALKRGEAAFARAA